jgi:hypothetical protein
MGFLLSLVRSDTRWSQPDAAKGSFNFTFLLGSRLRSAKNYRGEQQPESARLRAFRLQPVGHVTD